SDIRSVELPLLPVERQREMIRQLEEADEILRKACEIRKEKYLEAYQKIGIGPFIRPVSK
ncbi:MAG: hypothetical protein CW346_19515, partial [Bacillaceae bacterium]|nr:hypothetical protein [Bacillaceae bacterium]